ncbi:MFS transporter [Streptomyces sp. NPDC049954]|uniref:MFS transporter n=1 Tax=Streptomyces sp. NPDC049954 TaxID=3155779 RepID=UPI003434D379
MSKIKAVGMARLTPIIWITGVAALISLMGSSLKSTVQVYFVPMAHSFGEPRDRFAVATTLFAIVMAVASPFIGALSDRYGPLVVLRSGLVASALMFVCVSLVQNFVLLTVVYGILGALSYASLSYIPIGVLVDRVFPPERKGFFYALLTNGTAIGFIVLVPLWVWLQHLTDWRSVMLAVGVFMGLILLPLSFTLRRHRWAGSAAPQAPAATGPRGLSVLRRGPFAALAAAFFACGITMAFVDVHMVPMLHDHHVGAPAVSSAMVLLGLTEVIGAFVTGMVCDRGRIRMILILAYLLRGVSVTLLAIAPNAVVVQVFGVIFGTSYLMTVVATTTWIIKLYPARVRGLLLGVLWTVHQVGAALSSQIGAVLHDGFGSYTPLMYIAAIFCLASIVLVASLREPDESNVITFAPEAAEPDTATAG